MASDYIGFRIDAEIKEQLQEIAKQNNENISDTVKRALSEFMAGDTGKPDVQSLAIRLSRLEAKYEKMSNSSHKKAPKKVEKKESPPDNQENINPDDLGKLITMKQAAQLTGFAESTLRSNFSRKGISAQKQRGGNRAGLYSKAEILDKIGYK